MTVEWGSFDQDMTRLVSRITQAGAAVLGDIGVAVTNELAAHISEQYPPAGPYGGFPARRTGRLRAGLSHRVTTEGEAFVCNVNSVRSFGKANVPAILHGERLNRPYMRITHREWAVRFPSEFSSRFRQRFQ